MTDAPQTLTASLHREENRMEANDREALIEWFNKRLATQDEAMRAYWAGRIDGHCLQNAISDNNLRTLAEREGFRIDWNTAA